MHPTVMAALAAEHQAELLRVAETRRRSRTVPRRTTGPFLARAAGRLRSVLPRPRLESQPCCA